MDPPAGPSGRFPGQPPVTLYRYRLLSCRGFLLPRPRRRPGLGHERRFSAHFRNPSFFSNAFSFFRFFSCLLMRAIRLSFFLPLFGFFFLAIPHPIVPASPRSRRGWPDRGYCPPGPGPPRFGVIPTSRGSLLEFGHVPLESPPRSVERECAGERATSATASAATGGGFASYCPARG
jgi:hypothetical protein